VDNNNNNNHNNNKKGRRSPEEKDWERELVCLWDYATYLNDHFILVRLDRGGIHPTTVGPRWQRDK
jgi:hypothetical protein